MSSDRMKFAREVAPRVVFWALTVLVFSLPFIAQATAHGFSGRWQIDGKKKFVLFPWQLTTRISTTAFQLRFRDGSGQRKVTWQLDGREHPCDLRELCQSYRARLQDGQVRVAVTGGALDTQSLTFSLAGEGQQLRVSRDVATGCGDVPAERCERTIAVTDTYRRDSVWHSLFTAAP